VPGIFLSSLEACLILSTSWQAGYNQCPNCVDDETDPHVRQIVNGHRVNVQAREPSPRVCPFNALVHAALYGDKKRGTILSNMFRKISD
jgi:hypothetical protein